MKKIWSKLVVLILILGSFSNISQISFAADINTNAAQFVDSVTLSNNDGPIGLNKISDSSSVNVSYNLEIPDGVIIDTSQEYTMSLPPELKYQTTSPIQLKKADGTLLGQVTIQNNIITIIFEPTINSLSNRSLFFNFWSGFNKNTLNYDTGNDLLFPTKNDPNNSIHVNFSKSSSGGGSGASAISKTLRYGEDNTVTWTITINNGGYSVSNAKFLDTMENTQNYIPGSTTINFRNYKNNIIQTSKTDLSFISNGDGTQSVMMNFGRLYSDEEAIATETTSIVIRYQSKMIYNSMNNKYPNHAYSYDQDTLIDSAVSTATYRGQGGGGEGDVAGDIHVKYVDESGNEIASPDTLTGNIGDNYTTSPKDVPGYTLEKVEGTANGTFTADEQNVTYIYKKDPVPAGDIHVKYVDELGNEIASSDTLTGNVGDNYTTGPKDIPGYTLEKVEGTANGTFTANEQNLTYIYKKDPVPAGDIHVKYVDESGNEIASPDTLTGNVGDSYTTSPKDIPGYTFEKVEGNTNKTFTADEQNVTYIYKKDPIPAGDIHVKYVDESGNEIASFDTLTGNVGNNYTTVPKDIPGYTLEKVEGTANGTFTADEQNVTYIYKKNPVPTVSGNDINNNQSHSQAKQHDSIRNRILGKDIILPVTGESESLAIIEMIYGLLSIFGSTIIIVFTYRKKNN